jgi:hypothetical protein
MEQKELKVRLQHDINIFLHHALPLCVITADEKLVPWYYEHYIEIYSRTNENGYIAGNFLEYWSPHRVLCEEVHMGLAFMAQVTDIVGYITEKIDMDYYVTIALDEYYIPGMRTYSQSHEISNVLIYGYDNYKKHFMVIGFDKNMTFTKMIFDYDDFVLAYENVKIYYKSNAPWCETGVIEMIKLWDFKTQYPFSLSRFLSKLYNYICSIGDDSVAFAHLQRRYDSRVKYGLDVYDDLINHLEDKNESDYKLIHLLYESKKAIYNRLQYIIKNIYSNEQLESHVNFYSGVVKKFELLRMKYLKIQKQINLGMECTKEKKDLADVLKESKNGERQLLISIYKELKINKREETL